MTEVVGRGRGAGDGRARARGTGGGRAQARGAAATTPAAMIPDMTTPGATTGRPHAARTARRAGRRGAPRRAGDQAAVGAVNSASMEIFTESATSTPPASRAAFQVRPNSLREMVVSPVKPAR